jgi:hypothetical protein
MRDRRNYPFWVKIGLWGLPTRVSALAFAWFSVASALVGLIGGFWNPLLFYGLFFLFSAWGYWSAISWVDKNDRW